jgi:hypothetical protein
MDSLPNWAWWLIVAGLLFSPVFALLIAILVEIFVEVLREGGLTAIITLVVAGLTGRLLLRRLRMRPGLPETVEDQA